MPRTSQAGITIGFLGTGEMEVDPATDLIEVYINESVKPDESVRLVFPVTEAEFSDSLDQIASMARKNRLAYEVITNSDDKKRRPFQEVLNAAANTHLVTDVWTQMEQILVDAPKAALFVLWDEKRDKELQEICGRFADAEISVLDLTNGLAPLLDQDEAVEPTPDEPDAADEAEDDEEEPQAATTVYTRPQLEKMNHSDVKDIAVSMGLAPRKARENMIVAILDAQGTPEPVTVASVEPQAVAAVSSDFDATVTLLDGLENILDQFGKQFMEGLDEWLTKFSTAAEGWVFNTTPEEPMQEPAPEPPRRRFTR